MANSGTKHLKLYTEQPPEVFRPQPENLGSLAGVIEAFERATGWSLRYLPGPAPAQGSGPAWSVPVELGDGMPPAHLRLDSPDPGPAAGGGPPDRDAASALAAAVAGMLGELVDTRRALWQREAELAAGVPLIPHAAQEQHLAATLQAVLKAGADAVDCQAAALYLLDDATTALKLRSAWNLPPDRMTVPARPLRGAVADLEALLGHVVVLKDPELVASWKVPEDFPAAVCVPVSTPTTLLGTLWVYCTARRDFDDRQTNIIEVVAGRLAADLQNEMLLREGFDAARLKRQLDAAQQLQENQLPTISPLLDGWDLAAWTAHAEPVGGSFHDWFCLPDGLLAVAVGDALGEGLPAAMAASTLKAALRSHGQYHRQAERALKQVNLTLWTGSAGDQLAAAFYGVIETATGRVCCSSAGRVAIVLVRADGWTSLGPCSAPLGEGPETDFEQFGIELQPGEALVAFTEGFHAAAGADGRPLGHSGVAEALVGRLDLSADRLVALARDALQTHAPDSQRRDRTILVVRRTRT